MSSTIIDRLIELPPVLFDLLRGYATLSPIRFLVFPCSLGCDTAHGFLLNDILLNPLFTKYPPSLQYQATFWKWALDNLEKIVNSEDFEIDAQLYEHYVSLIPASSPQTVGVQPPAPSYITYFWNAGSACRSATLLESRTTIESGTTGLKTWLASLVLAQFLAANPDFVRTTCVLELGCGVGLLGIFVATLQLLPAYAGGSVCLSDVNAEVLHRCSNNISLPCNISSSHPALNCTSLDWTDALNKGHLPAFISTLQKIAPDIIIGADVVYDPSIIAPLVHSIRLALQCKPQASALIALAVRNENTMAQFTRAAEQCLSVDELKPSLSPVHDFWGVRQEDVVQKPIVRILRIKSKVVRQSTQSVA